MLKDGDGKPMECAEPHVWYWLGDEWCCENCYARKAGRGKEIR